MSIVIRNKPNWEHGLSAECSTIPFIIIMERSLHYAVQYVSSAGLHQQQLIILIILVEINICSRKCDICIIQQSRCIRLVNLSGRKAIRLSFGTFN